MHASPKSLPPSTLAAALAAQRLDWIVPQWPAPPGVHALSTTRNGAGGEPIDLASSPVNAASTRALLRRVLPQEPKWLKQVHGAAVANLDSPADVITADGATTRIHGTVCAVMTADCLPILFADRGASVVAAAHAGWRGLAAGVIEASIAAMRVDPASLLAWLGPAIGPRVFEVGGDVFAAFCDADPGAAECFVPHPRSTMKWHADLYALARRRLARAGVLAVYGGGHCTFTESKLFHSYRRDGAGSNGRMATTIWLSQQ